MSYKTLETKIVKLIPSQSLKDYVKEHNFHFTQKDLLKFAEMYASTHEQKLQLLQEIATEFPDKTVASHAQKLIAYHKKSFDEFMMPSPDYVYEVEIYCDPDEKEATYITKTFDDALALIKSYLKHYRDVGAVDNKLSLYKIIKQTAIAPQKPGDLSNKLGVVGKCVLGYKQVIRYVEMYNNGNYLGKCNGHCYGCKKDCLDVHEPHFPPFLQQYDLVAFKANYSYDEIDYYGKTYVRESRNEEIVYGILSTDMNRCDDETHVVLLDNRYIKERKAFEQDQDGYYLIYNAHEHPCYAELSKVDLEEVGHRILDDYQYAVAALKEMEAELD